MKDTFGLVPPEIRAMVEAEEAVERAVGTARYLDRALKAKDPNLGLVFIKPDIEEWDLPVGAVAGRWHLQYKAPEFISTYIPIVGPNGSYRDPASDILDMADRGDLRKPEIFRQVIEAGERKRAAKAKAAELEAEQRRDELRTDFSAAKRVAGEGGLHKRKWAKT